VVGRYSNPDADDDGLVDCNETGHTFMLDFHIRYDIKVSGTGATVSDIIDSYYNENTTTFSYSTTGVYIAYPTTFSSASTGTVKFVNTDVIIETNSYGALAKNTATSAVSDNSFSGYYSFGPNLTTASSLPSGEIDFVFGDKTLTFTKVETPSLATLSAPTGRIFPFLKLNKTNSACTSNCTLASFDYKWMKKTASGWEAATLQEVGLLVKDTGGVFSFRYNTDGNSSQTVQFAIPNTSISGTVTWTAANATLSGVTETAFTNLYTTQICHVGLSYDDKLGMRYFQNISNAAGTCS
jgi:hypothetical protein